MLQPFALNKNDELAPLMPTFCKKGKRQGEIRFSTGEEGAGFSVGDSPSRTGRLGKSPPKKKGKQ